MIKKLSVASCIAFGNLVSVLSFYCVFIGSQTGFKSSSKILANPVTSDGSNYRGDITEEEAFLWFDEAMVYVRGGSGGAGATTFKYGKGRQHNAPSGGSGGDGGNVIFTVDPNFNTLLGFRGRSSFRAANGENGDLEFANGPKGQDTRVAVPKGTIVFCNETNKMIGELTSDSDQLLVARGGLGGKGNAASTLRARGEKSSASPPQGGDKRWLRLELRLVADVGLVGVPNAGKSTLLNAITNAKPKIADYPFTTIVPNLGVCKVAGGSENGGDGMVVADIPGLLEGAHVGVGLGRGFLRHIERCKMVIHIVDGNSKDPVGDFKAINRELQLFSPTLAMKPQVVVLNKIDLPIVEERKDAILKTLRENMGHSRLLAMSAAANVGVAEVVDRTYKFLTKLKKDELDSLSSQFTTAQSRDGMQSEERIKVESLDTGEYNTERNDDVVATLGADGIVEISGKGVSFLFEELKYSGGRGSATDYYGAEERIQAIIEALGIVDAIKNAIPEGAGTGSGSSAPIVKVKAVINGKTVSFLELLNNSLLIPTS